MLGLQACTTTPSIIVYFCATISLDTPDITANRNFYSARRQVWRCQSGVEWSEQGRAEAVLRHRQKARSGIPPTLLCTLLLPREARTRGGAKAFPALAWPSRLTAPSPPQNTNLKTINGETPTVNLSFQLHSCEVRVVAWKGQTCVSSHNPQ